jgi:phospholipid/cholesterol/gamma-HCH transport system permease protein
LTFIGFLGSAILNFFANLGGICSMLVNVLRSIPSQFRHVRLVSDQMQQMGVNSLPLIILTSIFTGAVSAWQAAYQMEGYIPMRYLGIGVSKAIFIELAPVLTAIVVAGRVGASIAAELGTMRVTEQIDAMETLAIDPVGYLVTPRIISGMIMLPVLVIFADVVAMLGAMAVAVYLIDMEPETFYNGVKMFFEVSDVYSGLVKAVVFGFIIATMGCFHGFRAEGGAQGVGFATTRAVVASSVLILVSDYIIATLLFEVG